MTSMSATQARTNFKDVRFQMLSQDAQDQLSKYEHVVIWLMVLVAATSIFWSISLHILSGDFYNNLIGAKLEFRSRDFSQLDAKAKDILHKNLEQVFNETYSKGEEVNGDLSMPIAEKRIMPVEKENSTKRPHKISHVYRFAGKNDDHQPDEDEEDADDLTTTSPLPKTKVDIAHDKDFLATKTVNMLGSVWNQRTAVQFMYGFPFLSEFIAIVWTAMCLIYQTNVKKYWGVPKPWRIVLPSIVIFTLMTVGSLTYTIMANGFLKSVCLDLRSELTDPSAISCGQAMSILRPVIRQHAFSHTVYLNLFRASYVLAMVLWILSAIVMALRYFFAIDFQLVDVPPPVVCQRMPSKQHAPQTASMLKVDEHRKSDDDYASAKSHFSEVATPLLEAAIEQKPNLA